MEVSDSVSRTHRHAVDQLLGGEPCTRRRVRALAQRENIADFENNARLTGLEHICRGHSSGRQPPARRSQRKPWCVCVCAWQQVAWGCSWKKQVHACVSNQKLMLGEFSGRRQTALVWTTLPTAAANALLLHASQHASGAPIHTAHRATALKPC